MLLANISVPLLGLIDTAILGHLDQAIYLGAATLGAHLIGLLFWSFGFLRMGTTGFTARALGADDHPRMRSILQESCIFAVLIGFLLLATQHWVLPLAIQLLTEEQSNLSLLALEYASIRVWAAPAAMMTYVLIGWLIGLQKTRAAMWVIIVTNLVNLVLDYILIIQLGLNSAGAAWASLTAEYAGLTLGIIFVYRQLKPLGGFRFDPLNLNWRSYAEMFTSSRHLFIRTLCLLIVFLFFTSQGASIGENTLAANAILLNLLAITAFSMDGFAYVAETLCGHAWGQDKREQFIDACKKTTVLAGLVALISSFVLVLGQEPILSLYTHLEHVREAARSEFLWLALIPLISIWCYQLDGIFVGIGKTASMQNAMLVSTFLIYFPLWWLFQEWDNPGLWMAFWGFHLARTAFLLPPFIKSVKKQA